jgi:catechol 2,3-dioxygenase-like lactoylglutathione lyase family enzyme
VNLKSISGVSYRVNDLDATAVFYEGLGLRAGKRDDSSATFYVNWFWVEFIKAAEGPDR